MPTPEIAASGRSGAAACRSWTLRYGSRIVCHLPKGHDGSHRAYTPDAAVRWERV